MKISNKQIKEYKPINKAKQFKRHRSLLLTSIFAQREITT